ncbi:MAG: hypothetical protein ACJ8AI_25405, partial [Rhodopila sp.]
MKHAEIKAVYLTAEPGCSLGHMIPTGAGADWYARGVGGAAAREINGIPTGIPPLQKSILMPVGMTDRQVFWRP